MNDNVIPYTEYDYRMMNRLRVVPRWCVVPTIRTQNVAEHTFHVMVICDWLLLNHANVDPMFHLDVMRYALGHDRDESITGDVAGGSKPVPVDVSDRPPEVIVVKVADYLEAIAFLYEEIRMGNTVYPPSIVADAKMRMTPFWKAFQWGNKAVPKWDPDELIRQSGELFFDADSVHPVFDVPF